MSRRQNSANATAVEVTPFRSHVGSILFLAGIFFLNFLGRIILAPLLPTIETDLGLDHSEAGSLFLLISLGYFVSLLGSGFVASRLMHKRTIIVSATAIGLALLGISSSNSLLGISLGLVLLGLAAGLYLPSGISTLTSLINPSQWGKALAIHELAPNLAFVAAPLLSEVLLQWFSWRGILAVMGIASLVAGMTFGRFGSGGTFPGDAPSFASFRAILAKPAFWIMTTLFSLAITGSLGVYAMLPLYLVTEHSMDQYWANTLVAVSRVSGLGMAFLAGWATDRFGARRVMAAVFLLTGAMTFLLGVTKGYWIILIVFAQPMLAVCFFPAGFAALSCIGPSSSRNVAVSLTIPLAFLIGAGAIPTGIGIMGDTVSFAFGFALVGVFILMGFLLSLTLQLPEEYECPATFSQEQR
ncbi:MAG: MFS transporter [Deltaproteobacteria bacterium]|nr:MAG: MFS transporter [Deltaproteobacteria bacterium]